MNVHESSCAYLDQAVAPHLKVLGANRIDVPSAGAIYDLGAKQIGGLKAGIRLAELCMAGLAEVSLVPGGLTGTQVQVTTDHPVAACMASQYAGWPVATDNYFAMGSGALRSARGKEPVLSELSLVQSTPRSVIVLESAQLPTLEVFEYLSQESGVPVSSIEVAIARTKSLAGAIQIVARSVETCLHKLHELGFDLTKIQAGVGTAPLPPSASKDLVAMGWTNDAILYGGHVTLWVEADDDNLATLIDQVPSASSTDFGMPFLQIFEKYDRDFYKIDGKLFSPASVTIFNRSTGHVHRAGQLAPEILKESFAWPN